MKLKLLILTASILFSVYVVTSRADDVPVRNTDITDDGGNLKVAPGGGSAPPVSSQPSTSSPVQPLPGMQPYSAPSTDSSSMNPSQQNQMPQDQPPQGMPPQGMPPQGMPPQDMQPQGMPPQDMPQQDSTRPPGEALRGGVNY